uniref:THAP domain-containing protein 1 n=1 Tax=Cyprinus carpio TaxID=7962 RepID=A0A8C1MZD3_CYPCA
MPAAYVFPLNSRCLHKLPVQFNSVISFHSFPLNKETRKKWLQNIQREDCEVSPNIRVCSRHFRTDDFIEQSTPTSRRLLKKGAVPTLFTRSSSPVFKTKTTFQVSYMFP